VKDVAHIAVPRYECTLGRISVENRGPGQITAPPILTSRVLQTSHDDLGYFENCQNFCLGQGEDIWPQMSPNIGE